MDRQIYIQATHYLEGMYGPLLEGLSLTDFTIREYMDIEYPTGWHGFVQDMALANGVS